jgi:hypothetical protein
MTIQTYVCGSCAVSSLSAVGSCKNPIDVLTRFCKQELGVIAEYQTAYTKLACFYVFCAGPEVKSTEKGGTGHSKNHWPKYGTELAQYIKDCKLGEIVTLGPKLNLKHHSTSTAQLWAWSPDQQAVEAWWTKQQAGKL